MFVQPTIEVNHVVDATAAEADSRGPHLAEQREPDSEVVGSLLAREAADARKGETRVLFRRRFSSVALISRAACHTVHLHSRSCVDDSSPLRLAIAISNINTKCQY